MKLMNLPRRLAQITRWGSLGYRWSDCPKMVALGIARHHPFEPQNLVGRTGRWLYPELSFRLAQLNGKRIVIDPADRDQMIIFEEVAFPPRAYDFKIPFVPDMIFDCGAHIGLFTVFASAAFPGVPTRAFEPNPRNFGHLQRNVSVNSINTELTQAAVSTADGEAWFESGRSPEGHLASADPSSPTSDSAERPGHYKVRVVDFPRIFTESKSKAPLLKIDIEGEELRLIPALVVLLPPTCAIYFETHGGEAAWNQISTLLESHGFNVSRRRVWQHCIDGLAIRLPA